MQTFVDFRELIQYRFGVFFPNSDIIFGHSVKLLIQTILVLPIGNAEAERGFSIMNHIRTSRRSLLQPTTLDALMRVRINGPDQIEQFKAYKYTKAWMKNHLRTDDPQQQRTKKKAEALIDDTVNPENVFLPKS